MAKKSFSVGGLGGTGTTGALGSWDVLGKGLDKGNPWLDPSAEEAQAQADALAAESKARWDSQKAPELGEVDFEDFGWLGNLEAGPDVENQNIDTRLADSNTVDGTAYDDFESDPRLKDQQMSSLGALEELANSGGFNAADQAVLSKINSNAAAGDKGRRDAVMQGMQQRGMGGSGMELLAMLDSGQAATDRVAQEGLDVAGMAQDRALQAMTEGGNLAGNIRGQDFGENAAKAEAHDAINKFNAGTLNDTSKFNAGATNNTNQYNQSNNLKTGMYNKDNALGVAKYNHSGQQGTANQNTALNNTQTTLNKIDLPQTNFDNQLKVTTGQSDAASKSAELAQAKAKQKNAEIGQKKNSVIQAAGALMSDKREKKEVSRISDDELEEFFKAAEGGKKFKYKDTSKPGTSEGQRYGIMAQDIEGTSLGKDVVKDTKDGKVLDTDNLIGIILASLAKGR